MSGFETDSTEWDEYWSEKESVSKRIYDFIAVIYRAVIIKPALRRYLRLYFQEYNSLLHAGCGGGGVEQDNTEYRITALDISQKALQEYRSRHEWTPVVQGTILNLCVKDSTFDGVYNLGVMEHFSDDEIQVILKELSRVVKKKGIVILFWAPQSGATVIVLRYLHYFLNVILHRNVHLHPAEPSLAQSENWVKERIKSTDFKIVRSDFNLSNLYTYMIIVLMNDKPE